MPEEAVFFTRNVVSFFLCILGLGIMAWAIQVILLNYTQWWQELAPIEKGHLNWGHSKGYGAFNRFLEAMRAQDRGNDLVDLELVGNRELR